MDNTQAITAVYKGYIKQLWFFERTHKCSIGTFHEFVEAKKMRVEYAPTLTHRSDGFTEGLTPAKCFAALDMMSLVSTAQPALQK